MSSPKIESSSVSNSSFSFVWGAVFSCQALLSVAAGAFGVHALNGRVDVQALGWWQTASQYLMYHALAGLLVVVLSAQLPRVQKIMVLFTVGNLVFAGSLYVMTLTGYRMLGMLTPIGGVCYLLAWSLLVMNFYRMKRKNNAN